MTSTIFQYFSRNSGLAGSVAAAGVRSAALIEFHSIQGQVIKKRADDFHYVHRSAGAPKHVAIGLEKYVSIKRTAERRLIRCFIDPQVRLSMSCLVGPTSLESPATSLMGVAGRQADHGRNMIAVSTARSPTRSARCLKGRARAEAGYDFDGYDFDQARASDQNAFEASIPLFSHYFNGHRALIRTRDDPVRVIRTRDDLRSQVISRTTR